MSKKRVITAESKQVKDQSLCWDCACATESGTCPWATEFKPVDGWWAKPQTIWYNASYKDGRRERVEIPSYLVIMCPLFRRDAFRGGLKPIEKHKPILDNASDVDIRHLAAAIIRQSVVDWERLGRGFISKLSIAEGATIKTDELIEFFNSAYFEALLSTVSNVQPDRVRDMLKIPTL